MEEIQYIIVVYYMPLSWFTPLKHCRASFRQNCRKSVAHPSQSSSSGSVSSMINVSNPNSVLTNSRSSACLSASPAFSVPYNSRLLSILLSTEPTNLQAILSVPE